MVVTNTPHSIYVYIWFWSTFPDWVLVAEALGGHGEQLESGPLRRVQTPAEPAEEQRGAECLGAHQPGGHGSLQQGHEPANSVHGHHSGVPGTHPGCAQTGEPVWRNPPDLDLIFSRAFYVIGAYVCLYLIITCFPFANEPFLGPEKSDPSVLQLSSIHLVYTQSISAIIAETLFSFSGNSCFSSTPVEPWPVPM